MSQRWESSARPLFVKTIYVNGNRHAILSQKDPLLQSGLVFIKKPIRSNSCLSFSSVCSTNTQGSQSTESEMSFGISKSRQTRPKDISADLQKCLVKWHLSSTSQENKGFDKDTGSRTCIRTRKRSRKKPDNCKLRKQNHVEYRLPNEKKFEIYSAHKNKDLENFQSNKDSTDSGLKNNKNNTEIHTVKTGTMNSEKGDFELGKTFHHLVMRNKNNDNNKEKNKTTGYLYAISNSDTCEFYCNNSIARSFNTSLIDRVVQWLDLTKNQRQFDLQQRFPGTGVSFGKSRSSELNVNVIEFIQKNEVKVKKKSKLEMPLSDEKRILYRKHSFDNYTELEEKEIEINDSNDIISLVETLEVCNNNYSMKGNNNIAENCTGRAEIQNNWPLSSNNTKNNSSPRSVPLNDSVANHRNDSLSNRPNYCSLDKKMSPTSIKFCKKKKLMKNLKDYLTLEQRSTACLQEEKHRGIDILGKRIFSARNSTEKDNTYSNDSKVRPQENTSDGLNFGSNRTWMNTIVNENYISINKASLTHHILNQHLIEQEKPQQKKDIFRIEEGKITWESEERLEKPQLHIFIPFNTQGE